MIIKRKYKKRVSTYTILDPIDKLFGDHIVVSNDPVLVIGDTHCPYQNKALLMSAFDIAKERSIRQLIHAGDVLDCASYNVQAKHENVPDIEIEIEHARSLLYTAAQYFDKIYVIPGNHDAYYLKKEKITFDMYIRDIIMKNKFSTKIITTDYDYIYYSDFAVIGHPSGYDPIAGKYAAQLALKYRRHALVGHDHIRGYQRAENGFYGVSIGASFIPGSFAYKAKAYNSFPDSMLGFVIIQDRHISLFDDKLNEQTLT